MGGLIRLASSLEGILCIRAAEAQAGATVDALGVAQHHES